MILPCSYVLSTEGSLVLCGSPTAVYGPGRALCDRHETDDSFIYFVRYTDYVKIGWTIRPGVRLRDIMAGSGCVVPADLSGHASLVALVRGDRRTEQLLHSAFAQYRDKGEWFRIEGHLADLLAKLDPSAVDLVRAMVTVHDQPDEFADVPIPGSPVDF